MRPPAGITVKLTTQRSEPHLKAASLGPPENIHLNLKMELDVPERSVSLADVDLCARVGVAKLHLPDSLAVSTDDASLRTFRNIAYNFV